MIKVLRVSRLATKDLKDLKDTQVVFARAGDKVSTYNLETDGQISFSPDKGELTIKFHLKDGDTIFIGTKDGFVCQKTL